MYSKLLIVEAQYVFKTANVVVTQIVYVMLSRFLTWTAPDRYHPAPHHSSFLPAECPSCRPANSVKALKAVNLLCE